MKTRLTLDRDNGKLMGVCAGLARWADIDPLIVRIGTIALTLYLFPLTLILYVLTGLTAPEARGEKA
jgi:phage shock protein C